MNDLMNAGMVNSVSLLAILAGAVVGLMLWFFLNRASTRSNRQIELLEALLEQQKRQNALLKRLCEANESEEDVLIPSTAAPQHDDDFVRLVAKR